MLSYETKGLAKDFIVWHEGLQLGLYTCPAGKKTIGFGRNIEDRGISLKEAHFLLDNDIELTIKELRSVISNFDSLPTDCAAALIDMAYALGITKFKLFKSMIGSIEKEDFAFAADELLDSLWAEQVPNRAEELAAIVRSCAQEESK